MAKSDTIQQPAAFSVDDQHKKPMFTGITIIPGAVSCFLGLLGLVGMYFGIAVFRSIFPGYQTMAFSTSVLLILFGLILADRFDSAIQAPNESRDSDCHDIYCRN